MGEALTDRQFLHGIFQDVIVDRGLQPDSFIGILRVSASLVVVSEYGYSTCGGPLDSSP